MRREKHSITCKIVLVVVMLLATVMLTGCPMERRGPITVDNIANNYPPKIFEDKARLDESGSLLTVEFQPYDGQIFSNGGWIYDNSNPSSFKRTFNASVWNMGPDTRSGVAYFRIDPAVPGGYDAYISLTVGDPPGFYDKRWVTRVIHVRAPKYTPTN